MGATLSASRSSLRLKAFHELVAVELLKVRATRSVWGLLAGTIAATGLAVADPIATAHGNGLNLASAKGVRDVFAAAGAGSIFVLALAIVHSAGEFRYGLATQTFLMEPARTLVLAAKAVALALVALAFALVSVAVALLVALPWMASEHATVSLGSGLVWRVLAGGALATVFYALIGVGIGMVVRNLAAALIGAIGWFLVVETALIALWPSGARYLPGGAASALEDSPSHHFLAPGWGALLMAAWAGLALAVASVDLRRRDIAGGAG